MRTNLFQEKIIQNLDDMSEALEDHELDEFYVTLEYDKEEGWKAFFLLAVDGEPLAETEGWGVDKDILIEDIISVFGPDVDIID